MSGRFADQVALVTGASRGIGRAIARRLAAEGATVVLAARRRPGIEEAVREIEASGGRAQGVVMDIANPDSVRETVRGLKEAYARIAILVNNAGMVRDNLFLRMKPEEWTGVIETNLHGVYRVCREVVPGMVRARYGRIVNITSVVGSLGNPGQTNYAASKAGIEGFTRSLARELASRNITANCVAPGFIDTDMTRELSDDARSRLLAQVPAGRLGTGEDVAAAVAFLAAQEAAYITGVTLHVNGGMYM